MCKKNNRVHKHKLKKCNGQTWSTPNESLQSIKWIVAHPLLLNKQIKLCHPGSCDQERASPQLYNNNLLYDAPRACEHHDDNEPYKMTKLFHQKSRRIKQNINITPLILHTVHTPVLTRRFKRSFCLTPNSAPCASSDAPAATRPPPLGRPQA